MALTRAQLLMSNQSQGAVLAGQPVAVTAGPGITIDPSTGIISVNAATAVGVMRLNNPGAYNAYVWPVGGGLAGQQLTSDGAGNLSWSSAAGIPWTTKGQLVVGTGIGTDTILNAGANTAVLMADSGTTSGLVYSNTVTSAMQSPAGATAQRPNPATAGQFRYNTTTQKFEFATGPTTWEEFASADPAVGTFVSQTVPTTGSPSAIIPAGTTAQQQTVPAPLAGYTRFNTTTSLMEVFDGLVWSPVGAPPTAGLGINITGSLVKVSIPTASTPPAPGGGAAQAVVGSMYWDDVLNQLFIYYSNGGTPVWVQAAPSATGGGGGTTYTATAPVVVTGSVISLNQGLGVATNGTNLAFKMPVAAVPPTVGTTTTGAFDGSMYWDDTLGQLFIRYTNGGASTWVAAAPPAGGVPAASAAEAAAGLITTKYSSPATAVAKDAATTTGAALIPAGTDAQRAAIATPVVGMQRYNTTSGYEEVYTGAGSGWLKLAYVAPKEQVTDLTYSANTTLSDGVYLCRNLTINAGVTVTAGSQAVIFVCTGDAVINGNITATGAGPLGGNSINNGQGGFVSSNPGTGLGSGVGLFPGNSYTPSVSLSGSGGASGYGTSNAVGLTTGPGGTGGGCILISAQGSITQGASSTLSSVGGAGVVASVSGATPTVGGGGGGGSGGSVILNSTKNLTVSGTINVQGGNGAPGFSANGATAGAYGGGGGGGGVVILETRGTLTNTATITLTGGTGGALIAGSQQNGGGGGGSFGGKGGDGINTVSNGLPGLILFTGSPL
jgi:hypothetical protein